MLHSSMRSRSAKGATGSAAVGAIFLGAVAIAERQVTLETGATMIGEVSNEGDQLREFR